MLGISSFSQKISASKAASVQFKVVEFELKLSSFKGRDSETQLSREAKGALLKDQLQKYWHGPAKALQEN